MTRFTAFQRTCLLMASIGGVLPAAAEAPARARQVIVVVFDGLRNDSVTAEETPTLWALAARGTRFAHHHPVYLSSTEVNGTALATGAYPAHSGIIGNNEYRPRIDASRPIGTEHPAAVRKGDELSGNQYLRLPTLAERVEKAGLRSVIAGTKPVALLLNRHPATLPATLSPTLAAGKFFPESPLNPEDGPFPPAADATKAPNLSQDAWTTRLLLGRLWGNSIPAFTTLWLSEPDYAQHGSGPGSQTAKAALRSSDENLARLITKLQAANALETTDLLVVSDHGFSTISQSVDVAALLRKAGFKAADRWVSPPQAGDILVVSNGGSVFFYVADHEPVAIGRLTEFLQKSEFCGVILARPNPQIPPGTFDLAETQIHSPDAPDLVVSMRWSPEKSGTGMAGLLIGEGTKRRPGQGTHGSLSRFDMHNTLIAAGPDFKVGFVNETPSGNVDLVPTLLWVLGITSPEPLDGRVLVEALVNGPAIPAEVKSFTRTAQRDWAGGHWQQTLQISQVGKVMYLDEGNGACQETSSARQEPSATGTSR